jgi:hypothetical protein
MIWSILIAALKDEYFRRQNAPKSLVFCVWHWYTIGARHPQAGLGILLFSTFKTQS